MNFFARHPRYSTLVGLAVFIIFLVYTTSPSLSSFHRTPSLDFSHRWSNLASSPTPGSLKDKILESEKWYKETALAQRKELIEQYGHGKGPAGVDAFPTHGEMYTLWDFFTAAFACPFRVRRVGRPGDGGKWVCGMERIAEAAKRMVGPAGARRPRGCVVYSFGVNGESSFEADVLTEIPECRVYGYDYSVGKWGPEIDENKDLSPRAEFYQFALGGKDDHAGNPPYYTLKTLMKANGHSFIDILKIDIESAEFESLTALIKDYAAQNRPLPFGQLQLEVHPWKLGFKSFLEWWETLEDAGLRPFWTEPNLVYLNLFRGNAPVLSEYSFINLGGSHPLVTDDYE